MGEQLATEEFFLWGGGGEGSGDGHINPATLDPPQPTPRFLRHTSPVHSNAMADNPIHLPLTVHNMSLMEHAGIKFHIVALLCFTF